MCNGSPRCAAHASTHGATLNYQWCALGVAQPQAEQQLYKSTTKAYDGKEPYQASINKVHEKSLRASVRVHIAAGRPIDQRSLNKAERKEKCKQNATGLCAVMKAAGGHTGGEAVSPHDQPLALAPQWPAFHRQLDRPEC